MIIDSHTHLNRYSPEEPASLSERHAQLAAQMGENGLSHALVLSSYLVNEDRPGIPQLLECLAGDGRFSVIGGIRFRAPRDEELASLRALLKAGLLRGLKLYPGYEPFAPTDFALDPFYALAREFAVPVLIHTGDTYARGSSVRLAHPLAVDEAAIRFPDVTFVLCHLGSPWFTDGMEVVYKNENVFADISGLTLGAFAPRFERYVLGKLNDAIAYINDDTKLMFGSDWPISNIESYLGLVGRLDLTPEEREGLMWRNAARLFRLDVPLEREGESA